MFRLLKQFNVSFKLVVKSPSLTSIHHYNNKQQKRQQQLYDEIKHIKEVKGYGYQIKIADSIENYNINH